MNNFLTRYPNPGIKFIILEEADVLTQDAQYALRRILEEESSDTRFIFCCNYKNNLIYPLQSRCVVLRFSLLGKSNTHYREFCKSVLANEGYEIEEGALDCLLENGGGEFRSTVTKLEQSARCAREVFEMKPPPPPLREEEEEKMGGGGGGGLELGRSTSFDAGEETREEKILISKAVVVRVCRLVSAETLDQIVETLLRGDRQEVQQLAEDLYLSAVGPRQLLACLYKRLLDLDSAEVTDYMHAKVLPLFNEILSTCEFFKSPASESFGSTSAASLVVKIMMSAAVKKLDSNTHDTASGALLQHSEASSRGRTREFRATSLPARRLRHSAQSEDSQRPGRARRAVVICIR